MISVAELDSLASALGGVPVWGVLHDSPAARAGVRYGDIVLRVNGRPTPTLHDYREACAGARGVLHVVIFRGWKEVALEIELDPSRVPPLEEVAREVVDERLMPTARSDRKSSGEQ